jgi:hypothetical protein
MVIAYAPAFKVRWLTAMSDKQVVEELLEFFIVPYLVTHEPEWYKDRHMHKHIGRRGNAMTPVDGCACCEAKTSRYDGCTECHNAWKLTMVSKVWKSKVLAFNSTIRNWWWVWPEDHRQQRRGRGKGKGQGKGNANGYQPQSGYQPQVPQAAPFYKLQVPQAAQALATSSTAGSSQDHLVAYPPGLETKQYHADLLAEHGEAARPFVSSLQSERALLVDLGFPAAPTVAPTVLDSPTESWTTTLDADGNEAEDLFSLD